MRRTLWGLRVAWVVMLVLGAASPCTPPASASEALGNLNLELRLIDVRDEGSGTGGSAIAVARVEAVVSSFPAIRNIRLDFQKPDGTPWTLKGRPVDPGVLRWHRGGGGDPFDAGNGALSVGARDRVAAILEVPLEGTRVFEFVVRVLGEGRSGSLETEGMVLIPHGASIPQPEVKGDVAEFAATAPAKEVRP